MTPQYQQATAVAALIKTRFETVWIPYRDLQAKMKSQRRKYGNDTPEISAFRKTIQPQLDELLISADALNQEIYRLAQPKPRRYSITRRHD